MAWVIFQDRKKGRRLQASKPRDIPAASRAVASRQESRPLPASATTETSAMTAKPWPSAATIMASMTCRLAPRAHDRRSSDRQRPRSRLARQAKLALRRTVASRHAKLALRCTDDPRMAQCSVTPAAKKERQNAKTRQKKKANVHFWKFANEPSLSITGPLTDREKGWAG